MGYPSSPPAEPVKTSTPWVKLRAASYVAEKRGDFDLAHELSAAAIQAERSAEKAADERHRGAGSGAFRTDKQEAGLREDNQKRRVAAFDTWLAQDVDKSRGR